MKTVKYTMYAVFAALMTVSPVFAFEVFKPWRSEGGPAAAAREAAMNEALARPKAGSDYYTATEDLEAPMGKYSTGWWQGAKDWWSSWSMPKPSIPSTESLKSTWQTATTKATEYGKSAAGYAQEKWGQYAPEKAQKFVQEHPLATKIGAGVATAAVAAGITYCAVRYLRGSKEQKQCETDIRKSDEYNKLLPVINAIKIAMADTEQYKAFTESATYKTARPEDADAKAVYALTFFAPKAQLNAQQTILLSDLLANVKKNSEDPLYKALLGDIVGALTRGQNP